MDFTQQEWDNCIKVLKVLAKDPDKGLDINTIKGLVTKIYKKAKKQNKEKAFQDKAEAIIVSTQNLSPNKIQKIISTQDIYKQYDNALRARTALFQNYERPPQYEVENEPFENEFIYPKKCYDCGKPYRKAHFFYHLLCIKSVYR